MNLLLLGKTGSIMHWTEDMADDLRVAGHAVTVIPTRDPRLNKSLERWLLSPELGAPLAARIARRMRRLVPDLILAVGCLDEMPLPIFQQLAASPGRPPLVAWVGDTFTAAMAPVADLFDLIAYTDHGMLALHENHGFRARSAFVPLGATRTARCLSPPARDPSLVFIAAPTPGRRALLCEVTQPVAIFGPGWQHAEELAQHRRDARRVAPYNLARLYAGHLGALNIRHDSYVISGLNHRHFAPCVQATPVLSDAQPDLGFCFDIGSEVLVWHDADELNDLCAALRREPERAAAIGLAGQRRVLASHTYAHRLESIAALVGS